MSHLPPACEPAFPGEGDAVEVEETGGATFEVGAGALFEVHAERTIARVTPACLTRMVTILRQPLARASPLPNTFAMISAPRSALARRQSTLKPALRRARGSLAHAYRPDHLKRTEKGDSIDEPRASSPGPVPQTRVQRHLRGPLRRNLVWILPPVLLMLALVGWSYGRAMTAAGSENWSTRSVEWIKTAGFFKTHLGEPK